MVGRVIVKFYFHNAGYANGAASSVLCNSGGRLRCWPFPRSNVSPIVGFDWQASGQAEAGEAKQTLTESCCFGLRSMAD